ncbi:MAG: type II toxin-antitoxin system PemK/MazF family toxin [Candidatus Nanohaloarchaea archaeon]|nr:type II toxin-antitoxin system PemK/MazF family toxin [Candidatus Nanohaloarchaea archaeon]
MKLERGDLVLTDLDPVKGSEQGNTRPTAVIQNDVGNEYSPTTIVAPLTSSYETVYPVNVEVESGEGNLDRDSIILLNQITTVDIEERILKRIGTLEDETMDRVDEAIEISLGLD